MWKEGIRKGEGGAVIGREEDDGPVKQRMIKHSFPVSALEHVKRVDGFQRG